MHKAEICVFCIHSIECLLLQMHIHVAVYIMGFGLTLSKSTHCSSTVAACRINLSSCSGIRSSFRKIRVFKYVIGKKSKVSKLENKIKAQCTIYDEKFEITHFSHLNFINLS